MRIRNITISNPSDAKNATIQIILYVSSGSVVEMPVVETRKVTI